MPIEFSVDWSSLRIFEQTEFLSEPLSDIIDLFMIELFFRIEDVLCFLESFSSSNFSSNLTLFTLRELSSPF